MISVGLATVASAAIPEEPILLLSEYGLGKAISHIRWEDARSPPESLSKDGASPVTTQHDDAFSAPTPDSVQPTGRAGSHPLWRWFWLAFLVLSLGYAWYSFYVPSNDVEWADDIASARTRAVESGKPALLFFTAEWCVPCRVMKREVFADPEVARAVNAAVVPVMVSAGEPGADEAFSRYDVGGTPVTIFTDPHGAVLDFRVGGIGKAEFLGMLDALEAGSAEKPL